MVTIMVLCVRLPNGPEPCILCYFFKKNGKMSHSFAPSPSRFEVAGLLPLMGSWLCSSGLSGLSVPPGGTLHACFQERPRGQCSGG